MTAEFPGSSGGGGAGVSSFNSRTGAVSLSKADVTGTGLAAADVSADASGAAALAVATEAAARAAGDALAFPLANIRAQRFNAGVFATSQTRDVAFTWTSAFPDANYTVTCVLVDVASSGNSPALREIVGAPSATGFTARITSGAALAVSSGQLLVHAIAIHD